MTDKKDWPCEYRFLIPSGYQIGEHSLTDFMPATAMWAVAERLEKLIEVQEARLTVALETQSRIDGLSGGFFKAAKDALSDLGAPASPLRTDEDAPTGGVTGKEYCSTTREVEGKGFVCLLLSNHPGDCIFVDR